MESNEQTELTSKIETDLQIQSRLTVPGKVGRVEGSSKKGRKKKTHGQQCGNCGEEGIGAKNGDEKKSPLQENQDGGVGRHTAPPRTTRTDRKSKGKEVRHQGNKK